MIVAELFAKLGLKTDTAQFQQANTAITGLRNAAMQLGVTLGAGYLGRAALQAVDAVGKVAVEVDRAAQKAGLTTTAFEELAHAGDEIGWTQDDLRKGFMQLNRTMIMAREGMATYTRAFGRAGVSLTDAAGQAKTAEEVFMDLIGSLGDKSESVKVATALDLFGSAGDKMVLAINQGRDVVQGYRQDAHELGLVFSGEAFAAAEKYRQAVSLLGDTMTGLKRAIGMALLPQLTAAKQAVADWIFANRELISQRVSSWLGGIGRVAGTVSRLLGPLVDTFIQLPGYLQAASVGAIALGLGMNTAFLLPLSTALLLLGVFEEIWGWVSGRRNTLLEEFFGPTNVGTFWGDLLFDMTQSLKAIQDRLPSISFFFNHIADTIQRIAENLTKAGQGMTSLVRAVPETVRGGARATTHAVSQGLGAVGSFLLPETPFAGATLEAATAAIAPSASPAPILQRIAPQVNIGTISVGQSLPEGLSPKEFVQQLGDEVVRKSDLDAVWAEAAAAAGVR